jgi:hypothetical protein
MQRSPATLLLITSGVILLSCALASQPVGAQELGVYRSFARSALYELGAPHGLGAYIRLLPQPWLSARVSYHRHQSRTERVGEVCNNVAVYFACSDEDIETDSRVHGGAATLGWRLQPAAAVELEIGGGISLNDVRASERSTSGRPSALFVRQSAQTGILATAHGRFQPVRAVPLTIDVGLANHVLLLNACADDPRRYDPFCGRTSVREVRIGAGYAWR